MGFGSKTVDPNPGHDGGHVKPKDIERGRITEETAGCSRRGTPGPATQAVARAYRQAQGHWQSRAAGT